MNNNTGFDPNTNQPLNNTVQQNQSQNNQPTKKGGNTAVKVLAIIGGVVVGIIVLVVAIFSFVSASSKKLVCESKEGNITLMYNDTTITGYTAKGITYDMDQQKEVANRIGIESYIPEFKVWFETNTTGTCKIK